MKRFDKKWYWGDEMQEVAEQYARWKMNKEFDAIKSTELFFDKSEIAVVTFSNGSKIKVRPRKLSAYCVNITYKGMDFKTISCIYAESEKECIRLLKERLLSSDNVLDASMAMKATFKILRISSALAQIRLNSTQEV